MNLQETNLNDILSFYFYGTNAHEALEELQRKIDAGREKWLRRMLRDYRDDPVYDPDEIAFREGVDDLMTFCNVVEYAATGRLISMQPSGHWSWVPLSRVLRNVHVGKYYRDFYPDRLPQLLLERIEGRHEAVEGPGAENRCIRFLDLDRQFVRNHGSGYLLKLLDDFTIDGIRFSDVTKQFETPDLILDSLFKTEDEKEAIDEAVSEFSQFMSFCDILAEELEQTQEFPLLQAEAWSRYGYWFEIIEPKMNKRLGRTLDKFVAWEPPQGGQDAGKEIQEFVAAAKRNLRKLFSKAYGSRIDSILATLGNSRTSSTIPSLTVGIKSRALILDDHPIIRGALVTSLLSLRVFDEIDTVISFQDLMDKLEKDCSYQLLILDLSLTDSSGSGGVVHVRELYPEIPILIFSASDSTDVIAECFEYGVHGFVSKTSSMQIFVNAIRMVLSGSIYIPPSAASLMGFEPVAVNELAMDAASEEERVHLTPKQREVFEQLMLGVPNKIIARRLDMAEGTVKTHLHGIYQLLRVSSRAQAILKSRKKLIID